VKFDRAQCSVIKLEMQNVRNIFSNLTYSEQRCKRLERKLAL